MSTMKMELIDQLIAVHLVELSCTSATCRAHARTPSRPTHSFAAVAPRLHRALEDPPKAHAAAAARGAPPRE